MTSKDLKEGKGNQGVALVDLAFVLVIVGLLFWGVLKAGALIKNAQLQSDIRKLEGLQLAYILYKDKHSMMPGEDPDRPGRFKTVLSTEPNINYGLFYDLQQSGIINQVDLQAGVGEAFKATWGGSSGANYGLIAGKNQVCLTNIDVGLASIIEDRLDDGVNSQGDLEYTQNGSQLCMLIH